MELASYLAGERWSDHPACTHPLLGLLARLVDDHISDSARQRLTLLVPEVIGLTSEDLRVDARITLTCSTTALPVVSAERQRVMAVSMLTCLRVLGHLDVDPVTPVTKRTRTALAQVPDATDWAERFSRDITPSAAVFRGRSAPAAVRLAVLGIGLLRRGAGRTALPAPPYRHSGMGQLHLGSTGVPPHRPQPGARRHAALPGLDSST
jgi:hypothetical protein